MPRTRQVTRASIFASGKPKALVNWLRKVKPSKLRCETDEGEKLVACPAKGGSRQEATWARAVMALGALKVEALDEGGDTLDVFRLVEPEADGIDPGASAYVRDDDDSEAERMLKTFGQLLAAAHHSAARQLVDTVQLITTHFSEERQSLRGQAEALERLNSRLARRVRVDADSPDAEPEEAGGGMDILGDLAKFAELKKVMDMGRSAAGEAPPKANGAGGKD